MALWAGQKEAAALLEEAGADRALAEEIVERMKTALARARAEENELCLK